MFSKLRDQMCLIMLVTNESAVVKVTGQGFCIPTSNVGKVSELDIHL